MTKEWEICFNCLKSFLCPRHKASIANQEEDDDQPSVVEANCEETNYATPGGDDYMPLHPSTRSWELNREQVNVIKIIGKGAFSEVAKATIWNFRENQKYITVAAKMLKGKLMVSTCIYYYIPIFNSRLDIFSLWILSLGAMRCGIKNHFSATCFYMYNNRDFFKGNTMHVIDKFGHAATLKRVKSFGCLDIRL